jgi:hypothetical protein
MRPDAELEIWDTTTGQPAAPGASKACREELARREVSAKRFRPPLVALVGQELAG